MQVSTLNDLFVKELRDMYSGERQLVKALPKMAKKANSPDVRDAGMIGSAQRVEHYEIAAYGALREYANVLGHSEIVVLLEKTLEEEKAADRKLTQLAEQGINAMAINGDSEEETGSRSKGRRKR